MSVSSGAGGPTETSPDVPFSLGGTVTSAEATPASAPISEIGVELVQALLVDAPPDWLAMAATFSLTVDRANALVVFATPTGNVRTLATPEAFDLVRARRERDIATGRGLWWRMMVGVQHGESPVSDFDFGDAPFSAEFLFAPEDYRADIAAHPDSAVPVWLAAYAFHEGRQHRRPREAAQASSVLAGADDQWPDRDLMWARWSAVSAFAAATGSVAGPSIAPSIGIFESSSGSGSTFVLLPSGRAVLSGGVADDPELRDAYLGGSRLPDLFAGAPIWVCDSTLNVRLESGMLSFCWWYDDGHWYRAQSPDAVSCAVAVPAILSTDDAVRTLAGMLSDHPSANPAMLADAFVGAVESGTLTRTLVETVLPRAQGYDTDAALVSLSVAGHFNDREG
ncbi:hypothetical protein AAFP30_22235 [Gordonia sp. CPCC 205515]|uniref:hypothetical protein n=1 Tax=Gordonia sp. CPCC 205515 TaxID=3140791 RepID=UPI003AF3B193